MLGATLLAVQFYLTVNLPNEYLGAHWGMSVSELQSKTPVNKASLGGKFNYAEHLELDPDVYVRKTPDNKKIEYYFFNKKLYKIFIVYDRKHASLENYKKNIIDFIQKHGPPSDKYRKNVFGIDVLHTVWQDDESKFDLRFAAGYIYQVRTNIAAERSKSLLQQRKQSI